MLITSCKISKELDIKRTNPSPELLLIFEVNNIITASIESNGFIVRSLNLFKSLDLSCRALICFERLHSLVATSS